MERKIEKMTGESLNLEQENIQKLKELFPNIVTDGKVDFDMLRTILGDEVEEAREKYQFTWNGKTQAIKTAQTPSSATLRPCPEKSKNWEITQNVYIEGDNLEVLKQLQKTYHGKVKMIYIDPPYNTGHDFIYKDNFSNSIHNYEEQTKQSLKSNPETSGRYHTDWLNMMYPRLLLARNLLSENGMIFISINDSELYNLKLICDEIFGSNNFQGTFIINASPSGIDYGSMAKMHEYALFYSKDNLKIETYQLVEEGKTFDYEDENGGFIIYPLYNGNVAFNPTTRPNLYYPFYLNPKNNIQDDFYEIDLEPHPGWVEVWPVISKKDGIQRVWRWGKEEKSRKNLNKEIIGYKNKEGEWRIVQKYRSNMKMIRSMLLDQSFSSRRGTAEVQELFEKKVFSFPKPTELIKQFILTGSEGDDIIMDFFSGSATAAHAVLKANLENDTKRRFIIVQMPEIVDEKSEASKYGYKTICEIGEERIRRAGEQIKKEWVERNKKEGLFADNKEFPVDIGFKVFTLDSSNIETWDNERELNNEGLLQYSNEVFKEGRSKEDVLYEIMLKYGIFDREVSEIGINGKTMYQVGKRYMIVCLEDNLTEEDIRAIAEKTPNTVVFKESGFKDDNAKINAVYNLEKAGVKDIKCI